LSELIKKETIENTVKMMQSMGVKGEQLDEVVENIENQDMGFGVKQLMIGIGAEISVGAVLAALLGLAIRNKRG
jgi:hypothetical protein